MNSVRRNPTLFEISYRDPDTGEPITIEREFSDVGGLTAYYWAEDYAYMLADKGPFTVKVLEK